LKFSKEVIKAVREDEKNDEYTIYKIRLRSKK